MLLQQLLLLRKCLTRDEHLEGLSLQRVDRGRGGGHRHGAGVPFVPGGRLAKALLLGAFSNFDRDRLAGIEGCRLVQRRNGTLSFGVGGIAYKGNTYDRPDLTSETRAKSSDHAIARFGPLINDNQ